MEVVDDNGGKLLDTVFGRSEAISAQEILKDQEGTKHFGRGTVAFGCFWLENR